MTDLTRFTFNRGRAAAVLGFIEEAEATGDWDRVNKVLTPEQTTLASQVGVSGFDPDNDYEHVHTVMRLIDLAESAGWLTGPSTPLYEVTEDDGMCVVCWEVRDGEARVPLTLGWQDVCDLIEFVDSDERDEHGGFARNSGAAACLDLLTEMTSQMNDRMAQLDAYVAAQIAKRPDPIAELLAVAGDGEASVIQSLRLDAGLLWQCPNDGYYNVADDETCGDCGSGRAAVLGKGA